MFNEYSEKQKSSADCSGDTYLPVIVELVD